jgi:hypothetical protein
MFGEVEEGVKGYAEKFRSFVESEKLTVDEHLRMSIGLMSV